MDPSWSREDFEGVSESPLGPWLPPVKTGKYSHTSYLYCCLEEVEIQVRRRRALGEAGKYFFGLLKLLSGCPPFKQPFHPERGRGGADCSGIIRKWIKQQLLV